MKVTNYQLKLQGATWIDVNSNFTVDDLPDRLPDQLAITHSSLFNLLNCAPGQRSRIFQPTFGSLWLHFIHEPILDITAKKMEIFMTQSIQKWLPQVVLDQSESRIDADLSIPGYRVVVAFSTPFAANLQQVKFTVSV